MDREHTQPVQPEQASKQAQADRTDSSESGGALPSTRMQIERTTTLDGRLLLLYTFEDTDE